jgi:type II secretory pathway component PulF
LLEAEKKHLLLKRIEQLKDSIKSLERSHASAGDRGGRSSKDLEATIQDLEKQEELRKRIGQLLAVNEELEQRLF